MLTLECVGKKSIVDHRNYPCSNLHRPILCDVLSLFNEDELKYAQKPSNILIACIIAKIYKLKNGQADNDFKKCLSVELGVREDYEFLSRLDSVLNYDITHLEELISIIFQTKSFGIDNYENNALARKQNGVFHTPYPIASLIAKEAVSLSLDNLFHDIRSCKDNGERESLYEKFLNVKVIDPACGTGIILSALIDHLAFMNDKLGSILSGVSYFKHRNNFIRKLVAGGIFGVDIDREAVAIARALFKAKYGIVAMDLTSNIKAGNSIATGDLFSKNEFSYEHEFESIFSSNNGFDMLVMNPPYERLKVDSSDFKDAYNKDALYKTNKQTIGGCVSAIKKSGRYPLSDEGVLDLYKLFIDRATQITNEKGVISFIVPFSLLGDRSCRKIRSYIFDSARLENIYCIPENAKAFHGVSQAFCVTGFKKGSVKNKFIVYEDTISVEPLQYAKRISINIADIKQICPQTYSIPICDKKGWEILKVMHKFPALDKIDDIINLRGEVDLTFGAKYITVNSSENILIRGNAIDLYNIKEGENSKDSYVMLSGMRKDRFGGMKLQYVNSERLVGQQIVNMGVKKRLKFALIREGAVANSCNFITIKNKNTNNLLYLLGLLNSSVLNWRFKITSTNNHVNNYELGELPIANSGKNFEALKHKIVKEVVLQCKTYSENRQIILNALVALIYGLTLSDVLYITKADGATQEYQTILEKVYKSEKSTI